MTSSTAPSPALSPAPSTTHDERADFADDLSRLGPTAPTILPGWDALELLEHLLHRERLPHLMIGRRLPGPLGEKAASADDAFLALPWEQKVDLLRAGPPAASPARCTDALSGDAELLIHHEDLLRAQHGWEPRTLDARTLDRTWRAVSLFSRAMMRIPADVTLVSPQGGIRRAAGGRRASRGSLRVLGDPLELLLWVSGRDDVARVRIEGDDAARRALAEGRRGL
ncbi:TIGR03085 family metal-binding protein [Brachybacterium sp. DNPG3]